VRPVEEAAEKDVRENETNLLATVVFADPAGVLADHHGHDIGSLLRQPASPQHGH
jgi:hypothetical protein